MKLNNADFITQITDFNHPETLENLLNLFDRVYSVMYALVPEIHCNKSILGALTLRSRAF